MERLTTMILETELENRVFFRTFSSYGPQIRQSLNQSNLDKWTIYLSCGFCFRHRGLKVNADEKLIHLDSLVKSGGIFGVVSNFFCYFADLFISLWNAVTLTHEFGGGSSRN